MGGVVKSVISAVSTVSKIVKASKFLSGINPFVALGVFAVGWLFMRSMKPEVPDFGTNDFEETERGILVNKQSNNASIPVIYGERLVGGTRVFIETSGTDNEFLYIALVLSEGEINAITEIRVDDKVVTFSGALNDNTQRTVASSDSNFYKDGASYITIEPHFGSDGQSASSLLSTLSSWGSNHKLSGLCYLALKFKWNSDIFGGIPVVQAKVQGKKVVTLDASLNESSATFSTNPAFCLLDYLRNERYGKGIATANIDLQSFRDASQVCITQVTPFSGGSDINIFDTNAVIDTSKKVIDNVRDIVKGMRGYLPYVQGKYKLVIETTGSASVSLTEDDIIGGYNLASPSKNSKYNRVICSYINPDRNFQVDEVQYPAIDDSGYSTADKHATMKSADGGFLLEGRFDFKTITSTYQAEEMAEIILRRSRESLGLSITCGFKAYELHIGDIVNITLSSVGFSTKAFRVLSMTFNADYTISLQLVEHQDSHYTWASKGQVASTPSTNLPNPFVIQPPASLTLSDEMIEYSDGTVITRLNIVVGASPDSFVSNYQVEAKKSTESDFKIISTGSQLNHELLNVIDDQTYDVRVKAINSFGVSSSFVSASRLIIGATDTPSDVEDFNISMIGSNQMSLNWTSVNDLDIEFYEIRYSMGSGTTAWFNTSPLVQVPRRKSNSVVVNALKPPFNLYIKAVDKLGNESAEPAIITSSVVALQSFQDISNITEETAFAGTFTNTFKGEDKNNNPAVTLDTITLFDARSGDFDNADTSGFFFDTGGLANNIIGSGNYLFANSFSLDAIYDATFQVELTMESDDPYDLFDAGRGASDFDSAKAPFDGNAPTNNNAIIQIGADDTALSNITSFSTVAQQGTFKGKFFKFRCVLTSANNNARPLVTGLKARLVLEKRTETGDDIASGTGTKSVTFTNGFFQIPNITVTGQDLSSGDFMVISNKSKTGFDIVFKNSSNTIINKQFDFLASGVGLKS
tara:strand:+ start:479 stop:3418 length:2940 start_codon:yes stop_codon:yes gene_type:complete